MIFWRVKPLDQILETAAKKSLKRQLGALQLTMLGIGAIIGTGIFVLTSEAAQKAGPGMMISFVIAAVVCALAALAYAELAAMVPVSGSAYTYTYAVMGELLAWIVGWALILEYAVAAGAVAVGWSKYMNGLLNSVGWGLPEALRAGPYDGGSFNLLAFLIVWVIGGLLVIGTSKSAVVNAILVAIKILALTAFIAIAVPAAKVENFEPFLPTGMFGVYAAAASIFFAYVGFDAVSTTAEEAKNPTRDMPRALILSILTLIALLNVLGSERTVIVPPTAEPFEWTGSFAVHASSTTTSLVVTGDARAADGRRTLVFVGTSYVRGGYQQITLPSGSYNGGTGRTTFALSSALLATPSGNIYPGTAAWDDVRTAVFGYFDTLAPGDTTPASRWPTTGSSVLYRGGLAAAMVTGASLLSATISLPASDQTPAAKQVVVLGQLLVTA